MKVQQIERKFSWLLTLGALMLLAVAVFAANGTRPAQASGPSVNVAVVGSPDCIPYPGPDSGMPTTGGALNSYNFTNVAPASVNTATLAAYDTVLLNVCSPLMNCTPNTLTLMAKTDLGTFVGNGGKLIIYDGECGDVTPATYYTPVNDYNWLPTGYGMTTGYAPPLSPPGAPNNTKGPIAVDEDNILSSNSQVGTFGPYYIDAAGMTQNSEVRDASYMTTHDPGWCLDMSVTKENGLIGWTHAYARYQSGLMIYNGLDRDVFLPNGINGGAWQTGTELTPPSPNGVLKIWLQELQAPSNATVAQLLCAPTQLRA